MCTQRRNRSGRSKREISFPRVYQSQGKEGKTDESRYKNGEFKIFLILIEICWVILFFGSISTNSYRRKIFSSLLNICLLRFMHREQYCVDWENLNEFFF